MVDWKWRFVRRVLIWELLLFLLWTASFYAFALAYQVPLLPGQPAEEQLASRPALHLDWRLSNRLKSAT